MKFLIFVSLILFSFSSWSSVDYISPMPKQSLVSSFNLNVVQPPLLEEACAECDKYRYQVGDPASVKNTNWHMSQIFGNEWGVESGAGSVDGK